MRQSTSRSAHAVLLTDGTWELDVDTAAIRRATAEGLTDSRSMMIDSALAGGGISLTIQYKGGARTITVPRGVRVTAIVPTDDKLTTGANIIVLATKRADGTLQASRVMFARTP